MMEPASGCLLIVWRENWFCVSSQPGYELHLLRFLRHLKESDKDKKGLSEKQVQILSPKELTESIQIFLNQLHNPSLKIHSVSRRCLQRYFPFEYQSHASSARERTKTI